MRTKLMLMAFAAAMLAAPVAMAEEPAGAKGEHRGKMLEKIDTDGDGKVSKAEFTASHEERFTKTDTDGDGFLSPEEMKTAWEAMREKRKARRAEHQGDTQDGDTHQEDAVQDGEAAE